MNQVKKGTDGLVAVLERFSRVRPVLRAVGIVVLLSGLVLSFIELELALALISVGVPLLALSLPVRQAVGVGVFEFAWIVLVGFGVGGTMPLVIPIALTQAAVVALIIWGRRAVESIRSSEVRVRQHQADLEDALAISYRQVLYAEALSSAARAFLTTADAEARRLALTDVLNATQSDLMRVSRNVSRGDEGLHSVVVEHVQSQGAIANAPGEEYPWSRFPNVMSTLASGRRHQFSTIAEVTAPDRQAYEEYQTEYRAMLEVPIMVDGRWEGTISLASYTDGRGWKDNEATLLGSVSEMIAAAWARAHAVDRLGDAIDQRDRSLRLQAALTDSSRTLLESDSEDSLIEALGIVRAAAGADLAYLESSDAGPEGPMRSTMHLVTAEGEDRDFREGLWSAWPYAFAELSEGRPYIVDDIDRLPDRERSWYMVNQSPVRAELDFPVIHEGSLVAVVGIAHHETRRWSASEMRMMGSVARMIGSYWQRDSVRRALEDLIRSKDRFIASVSHELRTPMAVVLGLSTELNHRREDFSDEETAEFIDLIARQADEVTHIIEDLLVAARTAETTITVIPEPIRIDLEIEGVISGLPSDYTFKLRAVDVPPLTVMADPIRTRQILRNLIINSHRHGGESVHIIGRADDENVHIAVADNGRGIPDERVEEVFEAYATSTERSGVTAAIGLGLTVSRQLARLMGGDVIYTKDAMSTFELSLPGVGIANGAGTPEIAAADTEADRLDRSVTSGRIDQN